MTDTQAMGRAIELAAAVRRKTSPNPWVGSVVVSADGEVFGGSTAPPGGPHAEIAALDAAGTKARGATLFSTLEPCCHQGRTGPCTEAIIAAGIRRVVVGIIDPDPHVGGKGVAQLRAAGLDVEVGISAESVSLQLAPYVKHRRSGRPWVVLKVAATLDGRSAAPDGTSQWITGEEARRDGHRLRADSDAILVGAGTVRDDNPSLTVRHGIADDGDREPLRVVLGQTPDDARVEPALHLSGEPEDVLDELGSRGVLQLLIEGGAGVAGAFHAAGLIDRYVVYLAAALAGGDDGLGWFRGSGAPSIDQFWRGKFVSVATLGEDLRIEMKGAAA